MKPFNNIAVSPTQPENKADVWIQHSKNLLPPFESTTLNGITYTKNADGTITANGTATSNSFYTEDITLEAGDYCLTGSPEGAASNKYIIQVLGYVQDDGEGATFSLSQRTTVTVRLMVWSGVTVNNIVFKPMIIRGSQKEEYEPYLEDDIKINNNGVYNSVLKRDTGWIDISSLLKTTYFAVRPEENPRYRRVGNMVYFRGSVYIKTEIPSSDDIIVFSNLPEEIIPDGLVAGSGITYQSNRTYYLFVKKEDKTLRMTISNQTPQEAWQAIDLSNFNPYFVD